MGITGSDSRPYVATRTKIEPEKRIADERGHFSTVGLLDCQLPRPRVTLPRRIYYDKKKFERLFWQGVQAGSM